MRTRAACASTFGCDATCGQQAEPPDAWPRLHGADPLRQLPEPDFRIQSPQKDDGISNFLNGRRVSEVLEDS